MLRSASERSRHHLDDLYRLGSIGHVRGIEAKLRELELEDPSHEAVAAHLRTPGVEFRSQTLHERAGSDARQCLNPP